MAQTRTLATLLLLGLAPIARADGGPFGVGLIVGEPTGVTGAYRLSKRNVIDAAIGIDIFGGNDFYAHAEFLFILPDLLGSGSVGLSPYLGPGAFVADVGGSVGLGARVPFGLSLDFRRVPLQIFAELVVGLLVVPEVDGGIGGAIGFRYYF